MIVHAREQFRFSPGQFAQFDEDLLDKAFFDLEELFIIKDHARGDFKAGTDHAARGSLIMRVFTPVEIAEKAGNKYVGVLVAAKFARFVNDFPRDRSFQYEKKLTTTSLEELASGALTYKITRRRRQDA